MIKLTLSDGKIVRITADMVTIYPGERRSDGSTLTLVCRGPQDSGFRVKESPEEIEAMVDAERIRGR